MPEIDPVILQLRADVGRYEATLQQTTRKVDALLGQQEGSVRRLESVVGRSMSAITGAFAGVSAIALAQQFLSIADTAKTLDAQLKLATSTFGSFAQAQEDVRRIAADTRSGLEETASLYGNFARGAKELGADQEAAARATETFSKALKISGADAGQASSATLQFGQALASGALRGDELNSVLEASPRLARLLTDSMGVPIGKIKELGEEGKLTSDKLLNALTNTKFTAGLDAEFAQLPVTFDDAMTQVSNAAIITFGAFDRGGQFSTALANFITQGTDGFGDLETSALQTGTEIRAAFEGLRDAFQPMLDGAFVAFGAIDNRALGLRDSIASLLGSIDTIRNFLPDIGNKAKAFDNKYLGTNYQMQSRSDLRGAFVQGFNQSQRQSNQRIAQENRARATTAPSLGARPTAPAASSGSSKKKTGGAGSAEAAARKAENERLRAIRDAASEARESAQLEDDINAARAALATAAEDVLRFQLAAIENERAQRVADIETQVKLGQLGREEADRRILVNSELASLRGELVKRREAEGTAVREALRDQDRASTLQAEAQLLTTREDRRDVELRILEYAYKEEEAAIRRAAAAGEIADLDEALANMRRRRAAETEGVNRQAEGPLARYRQDLANSDRANDEVENAVIDELEGVRDSISSAAQKALGVKNPILAALINSFIEQQLIRPLLDGVAGAAGGGGGFFGSILGGIGKLFGGARASGGRVNAGSMYRVNEAAGVGRVEGFMPDQSGVIIPLGRMNAASRGSGTTIINQSFTLDARGGITTPQLLQHVNNVASEKAAEAGAKSYQQSMRDAPGAIQRQQRYGN